MAFFTEGAVQLHVVVWVLGKGVVRGSEGDFVNQELSPGIGFAVIGACVAGCAVAGRAVAGLFVAGAWHCSGWSDCCRCLSCSVDPATAWQYLNVGAIHERLLWSATKFVFFIRTLSPGITY